MKKWKPHATKEKSSVIKLLKVYPIFCIYVLYSTFFPLSPEEENTKSQKLNLYIYKKNYSSFFLLLLWLPFGPEGQYLQEEGEMKIRQGRGEKENCMEEEKVQSKRREKVKPRGKKQFVLMFLSLQFHFILIPSINERDTNCREGG